MEEVDHLCSLLLDQLGAPRKVEVLT
uniref:Uncharacterized protein n=1 Tax=Arundo donax TaxID=35708 RepID=A0A0A9FR43_ARUDO